MAIGSLFALIIIGLLAGWIAGKIMRGSGFGLIGNIAVGIAGAFVGNLLFEQLGIPAQGGMLRAIFGATIGAVILLFVIGLIRRS